MPDSYASWLLVSDIDGTLNNKMRRLPKENKASVGAFVAKGGNFTLASGRNLSSLAPHYRRLEIKTPAIFLNGAGIYDFSTKKMLQYLVHEEKAEALLRETACAFPEAEVTIFTADLLYLLKPRFFGYLTVLADRLDYQVCPDWKTVPGGVWGKVTFFGSPKLLRRIREHIESEKNAGLCHCLLTSPFTLEVVPHGVSKGNAVLTLAKMLGVTEDKTAAIGDYYNDVDMLKAVAHPVCCGQAPDDIKEIAEHVACHCNKAAVADFIQYIEKNYIIGGQNHG